MFRFRPLLPLLLSLLVLYAVVGVEISGFAARRPGAPFTYFLDDAYIHMSIARTLAQHGVWGVSPQGFSGSSSSILWTLLLAGVFRLFGTSDLAPLWLDLLFAGLAVLAAWLILRRTFLNMGWLLAGTLAVVIGAALAPLVVIGMESILQVCLSLAFVAALLPQLEQDPRPGLSGPLLVILLGGLLAATRYEGLALVGVAVLVLIFQRRWRFGLGLLAAALLPVLVYGFISIANGWLFLPNSVLVKSISGKISLGMLPALFSGRLVQLWANPYLIVLLLGSLVGLVMDLYQPAPKRDGRWMAILFQPALLAHVLLMAPNRGVRYEAYLLALGLVTLFTLWVWRIGPLSRQPDQLMRVTLAGMALFVAVMPFYNKGMDHLQEAPVGMSNIYDQQVQMARFLRTNYQNDCVAVNDIGAVLYQGKVCVVDLAGLATFETGSAFITGTSWRAVVERLCGEQHVRVALLYTSWFDDIPPEWVPVGRWTISQNVVAGDATVTFFAVDPAEAAALRQHLFDFNPTLPVQVQAEVY